jgi:DNA-binding MarR family transcriptional regulator
MSRTGEDAVAAIADAWARERPDLDTSPLLVVGRIQRLAAVLDDRLRPPFAEAGLGSGDFDVLTALRRSGEPYTLTPTGLARAMLVTGGATTKRVDRLARQGLVRRTTSSSDGRSREVTLTPSGLALVDHLMAGHLAGEERLLAGLTPAQRGDLARLLGKLAASVEDHDASA